MICTKWSERDCRAHLELDGGMIHRINAVDVIDRWRVDPNPVTGVGVFHFLPAYCHPIPRLGEDTWSDRKRYSVLWSCARHIFSAEFYSFNKIHITSTTHTDTHTSIFIHIHTLIAISGTWVHSSNTYGDKAECSNLMQVQGLPKLLT